jgi:hypothetical protein
MFSESDAKLCSETLSIRNGRDPESTSLAKVCKTLDPSLPPTHTNITEASNHPQGAEWASALDHEMDRLEERNTFEVCSNVDQVNDKLAFRVTRKPDGSIKFRCCLVACGYSQAELSLPLCPYLCCWHQGRRSTELASEFQ